MKNLTNYLLALATVFLINGLFVSPASATLGGDFSSVQNDSAVLKGSFGSVSAPSSCYQVQPVEMVGAHVREYINPQTGHVFMIKSIGIKQPDFSQLLGSYADEFQSAAQSSRTISSFSPHSHLDTGISSGNLKGFVSLSSSIKRSFVILKPEVPSCLKNPEAVR